MKATAQTDPQDKSRQKVVESFEFSTTVLVVVTAVACACLFGG